MTFRSWHMRRATPAWDPSYGKAVRDRLGLPGRSHQAILPPLRQAPEQLHGDSGSGDIARRGNGSDDWAVQLVDTGSRP
jgi:hypothetical protein